MKYIHPYPLLDGDREAVEFELVPGSYNPSLATAAQYKEGDLVFVDGSGLVSKIVSATAASVAGYEFFEAGADWDQPFAMQYLLDRGVPLNVVPQRNQYVMTYRGNAGTGADYTLTAGDVQAFAAHPNREVVYDATEGCLVVTSGTTNAKVTVLGVFGEYEAGVTTNPRVIVRIHTRTGA